MLTSGFLSKVCELCRCAEKKIDQEILESFKNPIVTDSIIFPKQTQKHKLGNVEIKHELPNKKPKIKKESHKFQIV